MANLYNFDAEEDYGGFGAIPEGPYRAMIVSSEEKKNKKTEGSHLSLVFEIIEGEQKGRKVWVNLNLNNKNQTAVRIAKAELKQVCLAAGNLRPQDSMELHNIPMVIHVRRSDDSERNEISKYEALVPNSTATKVPDGVGPGVESKPPWKK